MSKKINHIDCFSGPGGICTGFKAAGINTILAIEKVESCVETYKANHSKVNVINKDIREVTDDEIKEVVKTTPIHIVTSGMPCETFSTAGAKSRSFYDYRQQLYSEAIRIAKAANSEMILFENVPAITTKKVSKKGTRLVVQDIKLELIENGYKNFIEITLNSSRYGIPQARKRYFLLASKDENASLKFPEPTEELINVAQALDGLPLVQANDPTEVHEKVKPPNDYIELLNNKKFWKLSNRINGELTYHKAPRHREGTIERFKLINQGENLKDLFEKFTEAEREELRKKRILPKKWFIQRNHRLPDNKPSKTITSHCLDELIHPTLNRSLTVREVARLQSFPDFYDFKGGPYLVPHFSPIQDKYEQIGDAVPPLLAYHWGKTIKKIIQKQNAGIRKVLSSGISK